MESSSSFLKPAPLLQLVAIPKLSQARPLLFALFVFFILRLPSLFEPHWYTDEAGYANTAWLFLHGSTLYKQVWNNKPPLLFLSYAVALLTFGPSEFGIHILSFATEALAIACVYAIGLRLTTVRRAFLMSLAAAVCLGIPLFNGDLSLPENFLIGFTSLAFLSALKAYKDRHFSIAAITVAGVSSAIAVLYQQTALAELAVILVWIVSSKANNKAQAVKAFVCSSFLTVAVVILPFAVMAGFRTTFYAIVTSYLGYAQQSVGLDVGQLMLRIAEVVLVVVTLSTAPRWWSGRQLVWLWALVTLVVAGLPNRNYIHFALEPMPALILLIGISNFSDLTVLRVRQVSLGKLTCISSIVVATLLDCVVLYTGVMAALTAFYYPAFIERLAGTISQKAYALTYDPRAWAEYEVANWLKDHELTHVEALVWSSDSWVYLLADLKPVVPSPAIYVDTTQISTQQAVLDSLAGRLPKVVITTAEAVSNYPDILQLLGKSYTKVFQAGDAKLYLLNQGTTNVTKPIPAAKQVNVKKHHKAA